MGLFVLNKEFKILKTFSHDTDNQNSITQNSIYEIYVDDSNAYWLGVREGGINIVYDKENVFTNIQHIQNEKNSIHNNNIRSIYESASGAIWFGTENGLIAMKGKSIVKVYFSDQGLSGDKISALLRRNSNEFFLVIYAMPCCFRYDILLSKQKKIIKKNFFHKKTQNVNEKNPNSKFYNSKCDKT